MTVAPSGTSSSSSTKTAPFSAGRPRRGGCGRSRGGRRSAGRGGEGPLDDLDRPVDAGAEAAGRGEDDVHRSLVPSHPGPLPRGEGSTDGSIVAVFFMRKRGCFTERRFHKIHQGVGQIRFLHFPTISPSGRGGRLPSRRRSRSPPPAPRRPRSRRTQGRRCRAVPHVGQAGLDFLDELEQVDLKPSARGTGDDVHSLVAEPEGPSGSRSRP